MKKFANPCGCRERERESLSLRAEAEEYKNSTILKKEIGITLVALIVTIIILMILTGVVVATITGNNGILSKSKFARETYQNSQEQENGILHRYENEIDKTAVDIASSRQSSNNGTTELDYKNAVDISSYISENNKFTIPQNGFILVDYCETDTTQTRICLVHISDYPYTPLLDDNEWGIHEQFSTLVNKNQTIYFTFSHSINNVLVAYYIPYKD